MKIDEINDINHIIRNGILNIQGCFKKAEKILMELNNALKEYEDNGSKQDKDKG